MHVSDQQALVIELMQALESGVHGDALRRFFHDEASQIEYPSLVDPRVGRRGLDGMIAASELGAGMLAFQRYDISRWIRAMTLLSVRPNGMPSWRRMPGPCGRGSDFIPTAS